MRAHNMCHTTVVLDSRYDNLPGFEYNTISWREDSPSGGEGRESAVRFVSSRPGLLPRVLEDLAASRKAAKRQMAQATDPFQKALYNGKQLAYKGGCPDPPRAQVRHGSLFLVLIPIFPFDPSIQSSETVATGAAAPRPASSRASRSP